MITENDEFQLVDCVWCMSKIICDLCGKEDQMDNADMDEAIDFFFNEGWRSPKSKCYCPKCARKKLKKSK